jgi:hypothetical protein
LAKDTLQGQGRLEPVLGPQPLGQRVHPGEGRKGERLIGLAQEVVIVGAAGVGEHKCRVVLVEQEDLRVGITASALYQESTKAATGSGVRIRTQ